MQGSIDEHSRGAVRLGMRSRMVCSMDTRSIVDLSLGNTKRGGSVGDLRLLLGLCWSQSDWHGVVSRDDDRQGHGIVASLFHSHRRYPSGGKASDTMHVVVVRPVTPREMSTTSQLSIGRVVSAWNTPSSRPRYPRPPFGWSAGLLPPAHPPVRARRNCHALPRRRRQV
jgi:hypothetical protein